MSLADCSVEKMTDHLPSQRLTTWKEIAEYIGRDSRTAKRYEVERRLPVRRMPNGGKSTVYALRHELDRWLAGGDSLTKDTMADARSPELGVPELGGAETAQPQIAPPRPELASADPTSAERVRSARPWLRRWCVTGGGLCAVALISLFAFATGSKPSAPTAPQNPNVLQFDAKGREAWERRTPDDLNHAVDDFTQAIVLDPRYAPAYVGLADSYNLMPQYKVMLASQAFPRAKAAAERAVLLAPKSAAAHRALAFVEFWWGHDYPRAMQEFDAAIQLDPNSAQTYHWYANALSEVGDTHEALIVIKKSLALDPSSPAIRASEGVILKLEADHPDYIAAYDYMAGLCITEGDDAGFLQQEEQSARLRKVWDEVRVVQAARRALARGGHKAMLQELNLGYGALVRIGEQSAFELALTQMRLGNRREAIKALEQAASEFDPNVVGLAKNSDFISLHGDPAFERLLVKAHAFQ
jgi:tetratricopeptide (TPR) repeat protein